MQILIRVRKPSSIAWLLAAARLIGSNPLPRTALIAGAALAATLIPQHTKAANLYWGTSGTWNTASVWGTSATGPFNTRTFAAGDIAYFSQTTATVTFATQTIGGINALANTTTTISAGGTASTAAGGIVIDVATGAILTWSGQSFSATAGNFVITKNGLGTLNLGSSTTTATSGNSVTLNAGTLIVAGDKALGGGAAASLTINGGTLQSTGSRAFANPTITIGGDFTNAGSGTATYSGSFNLGTATSRTITNDTASGGRVYSGITSGNLSTTAGSGLIFSGTSQGAGGAQTYLSNSANTFTGAITITNGEV
ncbi:MAG: hypothetical protein ORN83_07370, partial [Chthoniobacteraceae bacterium]|nr:hypothetical protein [Chthoniobacteraceae bacterium]